MIPNVLIHLDKLPLTINGKLDKVALLNCYIDRNVLYIEPRNEIESDLCNIWETVLKIPKNKVGIQDSFFKLGGDSILAVKLTSTINDKYHCQIKIVDVFTAKTIEKLAQLITDSQRDKFILTNNLNDTIEKPNIFMIHPAMGGSEVYIALAEELSEYYSCYGVDNYNLNNQDKINNLTQLAELYLTAIDKIQQQTHQFNYPYILLGWSFGGQIALEIASILEQKSGIENIQVILLDTVLVDEQLVHLLYQSKEDRKKLYLSPLTKNDLGNYNEKLLNNFEYEEGLVYQKISHKLHYSRVILFKATKYADKSIKNHGNINAYVSNLSLNNVNNYVKNVDLIQFDNVEHKDVCKQTKFICQNLLTWFKKLR